jgi:tetratricopeptide (TPR) repeat protein
MMSMKNAKCLDWEVPRTPACLELDETHRTGIRSLTQAIALDPKLGPAYRLRANGLSKLKEYGQAIRDYDTALELISTGEHARISYNDRGLAKVALGQYQGAVSDFSQSIALGCKDYGCYVNRADAYLKLQNYTKAIENISLSIKRFLSNAILSFNIDQFRRLYPEYDAVRDEVLCEKLRALFFPAWTYENFANRFLVEAKGLKSTVLPELYVKRGDAYKAMKQPAKAKIEYDRVSRGFPDMAKFYFIEENGKLIRNRE